MIMIVNDGLHGMLEKYGKRTLGTGPHAVLIEYFEKTGRAGAIFKYSGPDSKDKMVVVPQARLSKSVVVVTSKPGLKEEVFYFHQGKSCKVPKTRLLGSRNGTYRRRSFGLDYGGSIGQK